MAVREPGVKTKAKQAKAVTSEKAKKANKQVSAPVKRVVQAGKVAEKSKKPKSVRIHEVPKVVPVPSRRKGEQQKDEEEDEEDLLSGFSEDDASEEEDEEDDALAARAAPTLDEIANMPSSRDDASVRNRLEKAKKKQAASGAPEETGVVYVGRLPHGFFEDQLRAYFSQFGDIKRLRLSRNKRTGRSKHYGFMEFVNSEVAEIVVDTMNNYLLDGHLLQMAIIPADKVDPNMWVGANRKFRRVPRDRVERARRSKSRTAAERAEVNRKLMQREKKRRAKLARAGIDYEFPGYQL